MIRPYGFTDHQHVNLPLADQLRLTRVEFKVFAFSGNGFQRPLLLLVFGKTQQQIQRVTLIKQIVTLRQRPTRPRQR